MKLQCTTRGCTSEEFAFDNGAVILSADGEVVCCPSEENEERWIKEVYEGFVILGWIGEDEEGQEKAIPIQEFYCLKCSGGVEFKL